VSKLGDIGKQQENAMEVKVGEIGAGRVRSSGQARPLGGKGAGRLHLGIDIGSISSDVIVFDAQRRVHFSDYSRTFGRPMETVRRQLAAVFEQVEPGRIHGAAATGSGARVFAELLGIAFTNEVSAQAAAVAAMLESGEHGQDAHATNTGKMPVPRGEDAHATVIEMGGQDSKLIFLAWRDGALALEDFAINTVCAAGTGSFLDQQAQRLGVSIEEEFAPLALQSTNVPRMAGRCSVFAKSDMIHLQQQATPMCDIIAGLCLALARGLKSNLAAGRTLHKPIVFTGGVAANKAVVRAFEEVLGLKAGELIVPEAHFFTGAMGAVLAAADAEVKPGQLGGCVSRIDAWLADRRSVLQTAPRRKRLPEPPPTPASVVAADWPAAGAVDAYIGIDVGSISTKIVVMDEARRVLAKEYLMTAGNPLEAVRRAMASVGTQVGDRVRIRGAATTGSGRYLTGDFVGADVVINEITAQAAGAAIVYPEVDTIFEIGGQDSKYISLQNGVVVDFEMNHACAAGTGSFLEEQAQRLGIDIKRQFEQLALRSESPIKLGERCTVFIESDLLNYQQQGASTEDLVAGLSYSIVSNYLNRVVGRRKIGDHISFQGGTAFNRAVWAAFEVITGKKIVVPDHHEVTGALGAAAIAAQHVKQCAEHEAFESGFKGFANLVGADYEVTSFTCHHCSNDCQIKRVRSPGSEPLFYGSRCDRYNVKKKKAQVCGEDLFGYREGKLLEYAGLGDSRHDGQPGRPHGAAPTAEGMEADGKGKACLAPTECVARGKIGIPRSLIAWQLLPLFSTFFKSLGFDVEVSDKTDKETIRMGVDAISAQMCFPVKVAYGHVARLMNNGVDYVFVPSVVSALSDASGHKHNQLCPYVQSFPYQVRTAFGGGNGGAKLLSAPLRLGEGHRLLARTFRKLAGSLNVSGAVVGRAVDEAVRAQRAFEADLRAKGRQFLAALPPDQKAFVLVSRPYNGCDEGVNLRLPRKLADLGIPLIPMDMLDLDGVCVSDTTLEKQVYWTYGRKILRAAEIVKGDDRLFAVYLSNFGCGPDSFIQTFFADRMRPKPCLQLELDEHTADAGLVTRLEAFLESLRHYRAGAPAPAAAPSRPAAPNEARTLYVPYMGDSSYAFAAAFRAYGREAHVMPVADEQMLVEGRRYTTGKECLPCAITIGEMLNVINRPGFDPARSAFFMPGTSGPCRFGMYHCLQKLVLKYADAGAVPVFSPNQDNGFYKALMGGVRASQQAFMKYIWTATVGAELLHKVILRIRPFAMDRSQAQRTYEEVLGEWVQLVEQLADRAAMCRFMEAAAERFGRIELDGRAERTPVGIVGEIYVRNHPFSNRRIIAQLEALGAVCDLASVSEWVYYTNFTRTARAVRRWDWRDWISNRAQDMIQHRVERFLGRPLERRFGRLAEAPVRDTIAAASPYVHPSFEGEAILSIGKMIEYHRHGAGGVVNVMPFGCMPSTVVSTQTARISAQCGGMPVLNLSFDGQDDPVLTTRLEAFVDQVRRKRTVTLASFVR
jgi:predicted CoA-substrate-specific enzyme activase